MDEKKEKLHRMRDVIRLTGLPRRKVMYHIDAMRMEPVRRDADGRWFAESQVQKIIERANKNKKR